MKINKALRISIILIVIGLSLSTSAVLRSTATQKAYFFKDIYLEERWPVWTLNFKASPIDMRIEIRSNNSLSVYLMTHEEYLNYTENGILCCAILRAENITRGLFFVKLFVRGQYHLILERIQNINVTVDVSIYTYGIERDLIDYSLALFALSAIVGFFSIIEKKVSLH